MPLQTTIAEGELYELRLMHWIHKNTTRFYFHPILKPRPETNSTFEKHYTVSVNVSLISLDDDLSEYYSVRPDSRMELGLFPKEVKWYDSLDFTFKGFKDSAVKIDCRNNGVKSSQKAFNSGECGWDLNDETWHKIKNSVQFGGVRTLD